MGGDRERWTRPRCGGRSCRRSRSGPSARAVSAAVRVLHILPSFSPSFFFAARGEHGAAVARRAADAVEQRSDARERARGRPVLAEGGGDAEDAPKLKFRNYQPKADELKDGVMPQVKVSADKELEKMGAVACNPCPTRLFCVSASARCMPAIASRPGFRSRSMLHTLHARSGANQGRDTARRGTQKGKLGPEAAHCQKAREARATHAASHCRAHQGEGLPGWRRRGAGAFTGSGRQGKGIVTQTI